MRSRRHLLHGLLLPGILVLAGGPVAAPDIVEGDLEALQSRISQERGHPLLVNFWATWCVPCIQEMPLLDELRARLGPEGARMLAVSLDFFVYPEPEDAQRRVSGVVREQDFQWPVFLYMGGQETVEQVYDIPGGLPHTLLIGPDGSILDRVEGRLDDSEVERLTRKIRASLEAAGP